MTLVSRLRYSLAISLLGLSLAGHAHTTKIPESLLNSPPSEHSGLKVFGKHALKLGQQIPKLEGYQVRIRSVTMEPGGIVKNHAHNTRPGAFYIIKGEVTEIRGDKKYTLHAGDVVLEDYNTEHWVINNSEEEALLFVFDIVAVE